VGHVTVSLSSLSIAPIESEIALFDCQSKNPITPGFSTTGLAHNRAKDIPKKVIDVARKLEAEGRAGPRLAVSVRIKDKEH
jgi:hypothetical protein